MKPQEQICTKSSYVNVDGQGLEILPSNVIFNVLLTLNNVPFCYECISILIIICPNEHVLNTKD